MVLKNNSTHNNFHDLGENCAEGAVPNEKAPHYLFPLNYSIYCNKINSSTHFQDTYLHLLCI